MPVKLCGCSGPASPAWSCCLREASASQHSSRLDAAQAGRPGHGLRLALLGAAAVCPLVSASLGIASLSAGGVQAVGSLASLWRVWWVGDALGALMIAKWSPPRGV